MKKKKPPLEERVKGIEEFLKSNKQGNVTVDILEIITIGLSKITQKIDARLIKEFGDPKKRKRGRKK